MTLHSYDDYTTNIPLEVMLDDDVIVAHHVFNKPLENEHGGPVRLVVPKRLALTFILGGAIGNLCDRSYYGFVIDFIYVYYKSYYWPAFNIADSFISVGVALILHDAFKNKKPLLS